jgi:dihydropteroate synthase
MGIPRLAVYPAGIGTYTVAMSGGRYDGMIETGHGGIDLGGRSLVMGVLNVTPDSFSDGGDFLSPDAARRQAQQMVAEGADLIDVGGESSRPGSESVPADEQLRRILPAIEAVRRVSDSVPISVDTRLGSVAEAALDAGADLVNDISALRDDADLARVVAKRQVPVVLMHMKGQPATMQEAPTYVNVVSEIRSFLQDRIEAAGRAGIDQERIIIDPGIGFGKTTEHNLTTLRELPALLELGRPVLVGPSRKRFIGQVLGIDEPKRRQWGTAAVVACAVAAGVHIVRVHEVGAMRQVAKMAWAIRRGT